MTELLYGLAEDGRFRATGAAVSERGREAGSGEGAGRTAVEPGLWIRSGASDIREGAEGADVLFGSDGADTLSGGGGGDVLHGAGGADRLDGGSGVDTVSYVGSGRGVIVDLGAGEGHGGDAEGDRYVGIENVVGSSHDDVLIGDDGGNRLMGGDGADTLFGGGGADALDGGAGRDAVGYAGSTQGVVVDLEAGRGAGGTAAGDTYRNIEDVGGSDHDDVLIGDDGANWLGGGEGDDLLTGGGGRDALDGGEGEDTASYADSAEGVHVDLGAGFGRGGTAEDDSYRDIENVEGSEHDDVLLGDGGANRLEGGAGADALRGGGGADRLYGGEGEDVLDGGAGGDVLDGGAGVDTVDYSASGGGVSVNLSAGHGAGGDAEGDSYRDIERVIGSAYGDVLIGDGGADWLEGGAGADRLCGDAGVDTASYAGSAAGVMVDLAAGQGRGGDAEGDVLVGIENVIGSAYDDVIVASAAANRIEGGAGADAVSYADSAAGVTVDLSGGRRGHGGDAEGDVLVGIENVTGSAYDDVIVASAAANRIEGGAGNDMVSYGGSAAGVTVDLSGGRRGHGGDAEGDVLVGIENVLGSAHDDAIVASAAANRIEGGAGVDMVSYANSTAGVMVDLATGEGHGGDAEGDVLVEIENVAGSAYDDVIVASAAANRIEGGTGNDMVSYGGSAAGVTVDLSGGRGLGGDAEGDVLVRIENVLGSAHDDAIVASAAANRIEGGAGVDAVSYAGSTVGVWVDLGGGVTLGGDAEGDVLVGIENVIGSAWGDVLIGDAGANALWGGAGDDVLLGGLGADTLEGGAGMDTVSYADSAAGVTVDLQTGHGAGGAAEGDIYQDIERVVGSAHNDRLIGDGGANWLSGDDGNDVLFGKAGVDRLSGSDGADALHGGADGDVLEGGAGADRFVYTTMNDSRPGETCDRVQDFDQAENDKIDLSQIDADGNAENGDTAFTFIGGDRFSGQAGELCYAYGNEGFTVISGDLNGDEEADFEIRLEGSIGLKADDFIL
ncbi:hypothetical protein [Inquilinus sp. CA228]|uniref:hypothetical protein n=1 Tax=Inquilinus sp. CA228 TaxID=3455609 RepID=UPI003F8D2C96